MAISLGVSTDGRSGSSVGTYSLTLNGCTAGRTIVVLLRWAGHTTTLSSLTCSGESNPTLIGTPIGNSNVGGCLQVAYISLSSGGNKLFNMTTNQVSNQLGMSLIEIYGTGTGTAVLYDNVERSIQLIGSVGPTTSITTNSDNAAIFALFGGTTDVDSLPGAGYTALPCTNAWFNQSAEYLLDAGAAGVKTVAWGSGSVGTSLIKAVAFKESAASIFALTQSSELTTTGHATLVGDPDAYTKYWRVPSNAPQGTTGRMIVFVAGSPANAVAYEGAVTADVNGNFDLITNTSDAGGTKRFAVVHAWNGVTGTTSIYGGAAIAEVLVV